MRLLVLAEGPPTTDPAAANGSSMITAAVIPRLPPDVHVSLAWFADGDRQPDPAVLDRVDQLTELPVRSGRVALLAQAVTRLPRATWQRAGSRARVRRLAEDADVVYLHGLHTFAALTDLAVPVVAHEVDPWSDYWAERSRERRGPGAWYDRSQARRARRLERVAAVRSSAVVVVNQADADRLRARTGGNVVAVPNGTRRPPAPSASRPEPGVVVFVGTLDYPPNVEAVTRLAHDVLPRVRQRLPGVRVLLAGRRPTPEVRALAGDGVEVVGEVDDVTALFGRAQLAVYPGRTGRGTKNTVGEALAAGCPVVASVESARGHAAGEHLRVGGTHQEIADAVVDLLSDPAAADRARRAAAAAAPGLRDWDTAAADYTELLREAARASR